MGFDWKNVTPEQRKAMQEKAAETRRRKKLAKAAGGDSLNESFSEPEIVYGEIEAEVETPAAADSPPTAFELFLLSLDHETRELLSIDELRSIFTEQVAAAMAEKKVAKKKAASETAKHAARMEAGLVPMATREAAEWQRRQNEVVRATVELPPSGEQGEIPDIGLRIDQKIYLAGHTYQFTRSQWESYREIIYRVGQHELMFKGQGIRQRQWIMGRATSPHIPLNPDGSLA